MPQTRPSSSSRRARAARPNWQPPTFQRQDAMVVYENVNDVDLSTPVEQLLDHFNSNYDGQHQSDNTQARRAVEVLQLSSQGHVVGAVNGQRRSHQPQLPAYTQNTGSHEMTMESTPAETLPTYAEASNGQGSSESTPRESPPPYRP